MSADNLIPDGTADEFEVFATDEQREMRDKLVKLSWQLSHLWEYEQGQIAAWFIAHRPGGRKPGYSHCYVKPDGTMHRFENKVRIGIAEPYSSSEGNVR